MPSPCHEQRARWLDRAGIALSGLCLVHCLLLPIVLALLPMLASSLPTHGWVHVVLVAMAIPISGVAIRSGYRRHRITLVPVAGGIGLALLALGALAGGTLEVPITVTGSALLVLAHLRNWQGLASGRASP